VITIVKVVVVVVVVLVVLVVLVVEAVRKVGIPRVLRDLTGQLKVARIDILRLT
jgi:hypothetical protein